MEDEDGVAAEMDVIKRASEARSKERYSRFEFSRRRRNDALEGEEDGLVEGNKLLRSTCQSERFDDERLTYKTIRRDLEHVGDEVTIPADVLRERAQSVGCEVRDDALRRCRLLRADGKEEVFEVVVAENRKRRLAPSGR